MESGLVHRRALAQDVEQILDIDVYGGLDYLPHVLNIWLAEEAKDPRTRRSFVLEQNDLVVGFHSFFFQDDGKVALHQALRVHQDCRGLQYGKLLMNETKGFLTSLSPPVPYLAKNRIDLEQLTFKRLPFNVLCDDKTSPTGISVGQSPFGNDVCNVVTIDLFTCDLEQAQRHLLGQLEYCIGMNPQPQRPLALLLLFPHSLSDAFVPWVDSLALGLDHPIIGDPQSRKSVFVIHKLLHESGAMRIANGTNCQLGEAPWMVTIYNVIPSISHLYGGAILGPRHIITSAQACSPVYINDTIIVKLSVAAGIVDLTVIENPTDVNVQTIYVDNAFIHEDFDKATFANDICILHLAKDFTMNKNVAQIELPSGMDVYGPGTEAKIFGWGSTAYGDAFATTLHQGSVGFISKEVCEDSFGQGDIFDSMICAAEGPKDFCEGDIGGPLVCAGNTLCGLASWNYRCGDPAFPGVYTRVSHFLEWIAEHSQ
eukprot:maker-scaffold539_size142544-snap-gene-0.22 protein:Tk01719 transcript:maker-scaffold539_size142544-snap-gene-0.22-mRNA-1 annotation:"GL12666"